MRIAELEQRIPAGVELLHVIARNGHVKVALARTGNLSIAYVQKDDMETYTCTFPTEGSVPLEIKGYGIGTDVMINLYTYHQEHERYQLLDP